MDFADEITRREPPHVFHYIALIMMILHENNPPVTHKEIQEYLPVLEVSIEGKIPNSLIKIWEQHNGFHGADEDENVSGNVWFYSISECVEFNKYSYLPGYLIIADDDGGDSVVMMKTGQESEEIFLNTRSIFYPMELRYLINTNFALEEWHNLGCYTCFEPESVACMWGDVIIRLDEMPSDGLKGLIKIKKILDKYDWSMQKLIEIKSSLPYNLDIRRYSKANYLASQINSDKKYVSLWKVSDPNYEMPIY